jgi:hypothetical protein
VLIADPDDRDAIERFRSVLDSTRARAAFAASRTIRRWLQPEVVAAALPWFDVQALINEAMMEGADPLGRVADLHRVLTQTPLRRLPLWMLGSNDVLQRIADEGEDLTGAIEYQQGLRAIAIRNYVAADRYLEASARKGLKTTVTQPLRVLSLCLAGQTDAARGVAAHADVHDQAERQFWLWMASHCAIGPLS